MALPDDFSPAEHLQDTIKLTMNREVREWFNDVGADDWEADLNSERARLRVACTHLEDDSFDMTIGRMQFFYFLVGQAKNLQCDIYGAPIVTVDRQRKYKPQITLYFNNKGYNPNKKDDLVEGEISFRLMNESSTDITNTKLNTYATRIKNLFAGSTKFIWHKGRKLVSYTDWEKGYQLQLLVTSESEAKRIIEQVLDIQQHTPDWKNLNLKTNSQETTTYPANPGTYTILGKTTNKIKYRPVEDVKFRYATINIHGLGRAITLVDTTSTRGNALQRA